MRYREDIETRLTARHKACVEFSGDVKDRLVLDVGCWIGWYERFMIERGCKFIVGIDLDRSALRKAKKASADRCEFLCASAHKLPFKSGRFDAVSMFDVLEHLPAGSEFDVLSEANKVLNTDGLLMVSVPNNHFFIKLLDPAYFVIGHRHYALDEISGLMEKMGFDIYEVTYGGGIAEALSMVLLYLLKHLFGMEVPFKSLLEYLRNKEHQGRGFATLFIKAVKSVLDTKDTGRKRVIFLFNSFVSISGGDIRFIEVFKRVKDFGKVIITPFIGRKICEMKELNATYILTTKETNSKNIFLTYFRRIVKALFLKIEIRSEDILYSTSDFLPDVLPAFVYKLRNTNAKWVANIYHIIAKPIQRRGTFVTNLVSFLTQRLSFQLIKRRSDLIFVLNKSIVEQLAKLGFPKNKICVIGAGINLAHINQIPKIKEAQYDACFLGRLHPAKGIFDLIEIWKLVVSKKESARLAIIYAGSKDLELLLMKKIREENLEANVFMLPLTGDGALRAVKSSKVFVFPSHEEGWGIAVCEAMACGLPVIAYDLPTYREIFTQGIITVPLNDTKHFSEQVINLLVDDEKRFTLSKKAETQASKYDWDDVASRELSLMKNI